MSYIVEDPDAFAVKLREEVFKSFEWDDDDCDRYVTVGQIVSFVREQCRIEDGELMMDQSDLDGIVKFVKETLVGTILCEMAANGEIESSWDSEKNSMVFRLPEQG